MRKRNDTSLPTIKPSISPNPVMSTMKELTDYLDGNRKSATPDLLETGNIHRMVSKCINNIQTNSKARNFLQAAYDDEMHSFEN